MVPYLVMPVGLYLFKSLVLEELDDLLHHFPGLGVGVNTIVNQGVE